MSTVVKEKNKKNSPLGRAIHRSRGGTVLEPPVDLQLKKKVKPKGPVKDKAAFEKLRLGVAPTIEIYKRVTSVDEFVGELVKQLEAADKEAQNGVWDKACDLMTALSTETAKLPQLFAEQRDAEKDCRDRLGQLNAHIKEYRQLDPKKQDGAMLVKIDSEYQEIQKLITAKKFKTAYEKTNQADKTLLAAKVRVLWGDGVLSGDEAKSRMPKMIRAAVEREEGLAARDLEARVKAETLGEKLGPEVRNILNEHRNCLAGEVKSLKGYRFMDDVQAALDSARDKRDQGAIDAVTKDAKAIAETVTDAKDRQQRMWAALRKVKETNDNKDALSEARQFAGTMLSHVPEVWQVDGPRLAERIPAMLKSGKERETAKQKAMTISKEQRAAEAKLFKDVIEHGSLKGVDRTQFFFDEPLRAIKRDTMDERALKKAQEAAALLQEYHSLDENLQMKHLSDDWSERIKEAGKAAKDAQAKLKKQGTNAQPDPTIAKALIDSTAESEAVIKEIRLELKDAGSPATTPDSGSPYEQLMKTYDNIIKRAYAIRDAGGTVAEVESSLEHVPAEFWPPQFVENLQAWRKVERELAEERVAEMFTKKDGLNLDDVKECMNLFMETVGMLGSSSGLDGAITGSNETKGWMNVPEVVSLVEGYMNAAKNGFGHGVDGAKALESCDFTGWNSDSLSDLYDNIAKVTKSFADALTNMKNVPGLPTDHIIVTEVVPIISAIAAGIDLTIALNALRKAITMRVKTGRMIDKAELEYFSGKMRDGGALVKAIKNERDARNRQVKKKGVDVTSKAVVLSGEVTKAAVGAGWGTEQAVGHGLVIVGKAIEFGGKIVFAGIDWRIAEQVKKLIYEAQAGNPIARLELMENSGLYAKMYIAILAKEGHKLALVFVKQRGYDEEAVAKPAVSLKILREAMLLHADQRDETEVADKLGEALLEGGVGKGPIKAFKLVSKGAIALGKKIKDLPKDKNIAYNAAWKPKPGDLLSADQWQANKDDCIKKAGLYDESTGIGKALKPCQGEIKSCNDALTKYDQNKNKTPQDRTDAIALVRKTQGTIRHAMEVIMGYYPGTNQGETHEPMTNYLVDIRRELSTQSNLLEQRLHALNIVQSDWTPTKKPGTSAADWTSNWADAVAKCDLPEDKVIGEALAAFEQGLLDVAGLGKDKHGEIREKRVAIRNSLVEAGQALKNLPSQCSSFPGAMEYIDQMIGFVVNASQGNDEALNGFDWENNPVKNFAADPTCFGSAKWKAAYAAADAMGFCNKKLKDGGMEKALLAWEKHPIAIDPSKVDPKERVKSRKEAIKLLAAVAESAEDLAKGNPDSHTEFLKYIAFLRRTAHTKVAEIQKAQDETHFKATYGTDTTSWEQTYNTGVAAGAIPKDDKAYKELEKALSSYGKVFAAMNKAKLAKKFKEAYAEAQKAVGEAAGVQKALSHVSNTESWSNDTLIKYLDYVRDEIEKEVETGMVGEVLGGEKSTFAKQQFKFENKSGWQEVKKAAVNAGLIADSKSGFGELIDQYLKAEKKKADAEKNKPKKPDVHKKSFDLVIGKLKTIKVTAQSMEKETKNANFIAYFKDAQEECRKKIEELEKNRPA